MTPPNEQADPEGSSFSAEGSSIPNEGAGIPAEAEAQTSSPGTLDDGNQMPLQNPPSMDFWQAIYTRRSIRRFKPDPVPRELIDQVLHGGIWAPSSCNYQMWDLVVVDDPKINQELAQISSQMGNAPVNIVVAYGRGFSEENFANVQSAAALIENMSLAAGVLGLGSFWITQVGDADALRAKVGLPIDRWVVAVLALGYPKSVPKKGPKRRPLSQVTHYNYYAGKPIPSSADPAAWEPELLTIYQRARVLNGLRHNKPRAWEVHALDLALQDLLPQSEAATEQWLDVLPCTGILSDRMARKRKGTEWSVVERSNDVAAWCARRIKPAASSYLWPATGTEPTPAENQFDTLTCFFRLEGLRAAERSELMAQMFHWLKPGGRLLLGFVSKNSYHNWTEGLRSKGKGPGGVEYVLSPDPNIGPFEALAPAEVSALAKAAGFTTKGTLGLQATPTAEELTFRTRNFNPRLGSLVRGVGSVLRLLEFLPGLNKHRGRFQYRLYTRPKS